MKLIHSNAIGLKHVVGYKNAGGALLITFYLEAVNKSHVLHSSVRNLGKLFLVSKIPAVIFKSDSFLPGVPAQTVHSVQTFAFDARTLDSGRTT